MQLSLTVVLICALGVQMQSPASNPVRLAAMQHHFSQVFLIHEALIRGDLAAARKSAMELTSLPSPAGMPAAADPHVVSIRILAQHIVDVPTLRSATTAAAAMLTQCGRCHRAVGVPVAVKTSTPPDVGGIVGHMLEHQQAADAMLEGLVAPSTAQWLAGAERLSRARLLDPGRLPDDPNWTASARLADTRAHKLASSAADDVDPTARSTRYAQLMLTCADCHSLHKKIWGPTKGRSALWRSPR